MPGRTETVLWLVGGGGGSGGGGGGDYTANVLFRDRDAVGVHFFLFV